MDGLERGTITWKEVADYLGRDVINSHLAALCRQNDRLEHARFLDEQQHSRTDQMPAQAETADKQPLTGYKLEEIPGLMRRLFYNDVFFPLFVTTWWQELVTYVTEKLTQPTGEGSTCK